MYYIIQPNVVFDLISKHAPRSELKNTRQPSFLTIFEVFTNQIKYDFRMYDVTSEINPYLKRKLGLKLLKFFTD